jgi:hypothetical protein
VLRGTEAIETQRHNTATEAQTAAAAKATADAARATNATTAAGNVLTGVNNAAQTGAGLLQNRVTAATGALNTVVGQLGGGNLGGSVGLPQGWGSRLLGGLQEWVTGLGGGQPVYDAAAAMVNQANPAISGNPTLAQEAYKALRGYMDLHTAQTGQPSPLEQQVTQQAKQVTAPTTAGQTGAGQTTQSVADQLLATQQAAAAQAGVVNSPSTAGLNAQGLADNPQGRAMAANQVPVPSGGQAPQYPGQYNVGYQQGMRVQPAGMLATGPVVGGNTGAPWGIPLPQPLPIPNAPYQAPVTV